MSQIANLFGFPAGGPLGPGGGGTGTSTILTAGSVVFAGAAGAYAQDNSNLFWDNTNKRLGIGTTLPDAALSVSANTIGMPAAGSSTVLTHFVGNAAVNPVCLFDALGGGFLFVGRRADGTTTSPTAVQASESLFTLAGAGYGATGYSANKARLNIVAAENWTDSAQGCFFSFDTTRSGGTTRSEKFRITDAGPIQLSVGFTVATLPAAGTVGRISYVTDALAPTFLAAVVGGGAIVTPVFDNGSAWVGF